MRPAPGRTLKAISAFGVGKALPGAITFVSIPLWLAIYGTESYALYSLYWATSLIATSFATGWLRQAILRFTGNVDLQYEHLSPNARRLIEATPILAVLPLAGIAVSLSESASELGAFLAVAALGLAIQSNYGVQLTLLQRDGRASSYAAAEVVRSSGTLGLSLIATTGLPAAPWVLVASGALATALAILILGLPSRRRPVEPASRCSESILSRYWAYGWPMSLWLTGSSSLIYIDRFVVTLMFGPERAGAYAAAADIAVRGLGLIVAPVVMFAHPKFMRMWNTELRAEAVAWWLRATVAVCVAAVVAALVAIGVYGYVADSLEGEQVGAGTFAALALGAAAWQAALMVHKPLEAIGRTRSMLLGLLGSAVAVAGLNLALAPTLAEYGVALASATGALVYICFVAAASGRTLRPEQVRSSVSAS